MGLLLPHFPPLPRDKLFGRPRRAHAMPPGRKLGLRESGHEQDFRVQPIIARCPILSIDLSMPALGNPVAHARTNERTTGIEARAASHYATKWPG